MPILPENRLRYPKDWKGIVARVRERSGNRCEFLIAGERCEAVFPNNFGSSGIYGKFALCKAWSARAESSLRDCAPSLDMKAAAIDRRFFGQAFLVLGHAPSLRLKAAELGSPFRLSHAIAEFKKTNRVGCHLTQSRRAFAEEAAANW